MEMSDNRNPLSIVDYVRKKKFENNPVQSKQSISLSVVFHRRLDIVVASVNKRDMLRKRGGHFSREDPRRCSYFIFIDQA